MNKTPMKIEVKTKFSVPIKSMVPLNRILCVVHLLADNPDALEALATIVEAPLAATGKQDEPKKKGHIRWNTGRTYSKHGQRMGRCLSGT